MGARARSGRITGAVMLKGETTMKAVVITLLVIIAAQPTSARPLDGATGIFGNAPRMFGNGRHREAPAKRNDDPLMRGASFNRLLAKAGAGFYAPTTICRGDGERDVVVGGQGRRGDTVVGNLEVIDRAQCPQRKNYREVQS